MLKKTTRFDRKMRTGKTVEDNIISHVVFILMSLLRAYINISIERISIRIIGIHIETIVSINMERMLHFILGTIL